MNDHSKTALALANRAGKLCEELSRGVGSIGR